MHVNLRKINCLIVLCSFFGVTSTTQAATEPVGTPSIEEVQQSKKVTGKVRDSEGELIGATVMEKGTSNGVITDYNGNFSIDVSPNATLVISYVG